MHAAIISTAFPYPADCGKARMLSGLCSFLAGHADVTRVSYFHISRRPAAEPGRVPVEYHHAAAPGFAEAGLNVTGALLSGRRPALQEALTFSRGTRRRLWEFIRREKPDVIVADTTRTAQYLESRHRPPGRYLVYLDDLMSLRYERMLEALSASGGRLGDVLGNFAAFVPPRLRRVAARPRGVRLLLEHERRAMQRREIETVRRFERCFLINPTEVDTLRARSGMSSVHPLKLLTEDDVADERCDGQSRDFIFLGDLKLPHNSQAIEQLVREGASALERHLPGYRVLIVGRSAPRSLVEACARTRSFVVAGYVPDLRSLLLHARGLLAPLAFGSGVKIKSLEALRLGVPIIASEIGVEGLSVRPGIDYLPAADVPAVIRQMRRLTDDRLHRQLAEAGQAWFANNYAPARVRSEYERLLLDGHARCPAAAGGAWNAVEGVPA